MANRQYGLTIEKPDGTIVAFLQSANSAHVSYLLNGISSLSLTFDASSSDAEALYTTLETTLPVARLARDGSTVFVGPLEAVDLSVGDTGDVSATFTDWAGLFGHWRPYGKYKNTSSNTIVTAMLGLARWPQSVQQLTKSGSVTATASVSSAEQSSVLEQLVQAGSVAPFDWYVDHAAGTFKIASSHGSDKTGTVQLGAGEFEANPTFANAQGARMTMQPPRNRIWSNTGKGKLVENQGSTAKTNSLSGYGEFFERVESGKSNAQSMANAYARYSPQQVIEISVDPVLAPAWLTDYYLGDTIGVSISTRAFQASNSLRVNQIDVELDEQLVEVSNSLTFEKV